MTAEDRSNASLPGFLSGRHSSGGRKPPCPVGFLGSPHTQARLWGPLETLIPGTWGVSIREDPVSV